MSILTESFVAWIIVAVALLGIGVSFYKWLNKPAFLWGGLGGAVLALALGAVCVFFVQTDAKRVKQTVFDMAAAVERNDVEATCSYLAESATQVERLARTNMALAKIERVKVSDYELVELNRFTSPPKAIVSCRATASGVSSNSAIFGAGSQVPFTVYLIFTAIELRKEADGQWRVTDECQFKTPGGQSPQSL